MSHFRLSHFRFALLPAALALALGASPARAVTCNDARTANAADLARWAAQLNVSPDYLAKLMNTAFCGSQAQRERVIASRPRKSPGKTATD